MKEQHLYPDSTAGCINFFLLSFLKLTVVCVGVTPVRLSGTGFNVAVPTIPTQPNLPAIHYMHSYYLPVT